MGEIRDPSNDEEADEKDPDSIDGDHSIVLIIKKILLAPQQEEKDDLRWTNIFHTRCTVQDKVCEMIIDSDNTENIVSLEPVKKLGLATEKHSRLYKFT